jgi:division protein CdvB (Snf7/Vps24/ESCRT-III family)
MPTRAGTIGTTEKSAATRVDREFRLQPDFPQRIKVRARQPLKDDAVFTTILAYLEQDLKANPKRTAGLTKRAIARAAQVTRRLKASLRRLSSADISLQLSTASNQDSAKPAR